MWKINTLLKSQLLKLSFSAPQKLDSSKVSFLTRNSSRHQHCVYGAGLLTVQAKLHCAVEGLLISQCVSPNRIIFIFAGEGILWQ